MEELRGKNRTGVMAAGPVDAFSIGREPSKNNHYNRREAPDFERGGVCRDFAVKRHCCWFKHMKRIAATLAIVSVVGLALYVWGKPLWNPILVKVMGGTSVNEVIVNIEEAVVSRIPANVVGSDVVIIALKEERIVELWSKQDTGWEKVKVYPFTGFSGRIGPKLKEGDRQIPEGVYEVTGLNPNSSYHLSIKINYPNEMDLRNASIDGRTDIGSNIFIHGQTQSIGCIPIGNEAIEELFYICHKSKEPPKVIIAPYDLRAIEPKSTPDSPVWTNELYNYISSSMLQYTN